VTTTKLTGRSRGLWPSDGGSTGKASTPGMPLNFGKSSLTTAAELRSLAFQSVSPTKEMPWLTVGLPATTK
jgi:hypothetical protein